MRASLSVLAVGSALLLAPLAAAAQPPPHKVGEVVAIGSGAQYLKSVIIAIDPNAAFPYRVHPLGYLSTMDSSVAAAGLHALGSVPVQPVGGIADDPWLMRLTGATAFHATQLYRGKYECWHFSRAAMMLNFTIIDDANYRDAGGAAGTYRFDAASSKLTFLGGALTGQHASYQQVSDPPTASQPPTVTLETSGDHCQRRP